MIHFSGVALGEACSVVLRGATQQILDEAERSLHDALCVLSQTVKETKVVYGGGSSEMLMANAVNELANQTPGKEAMAMESFAHALRQVGFCLLLSNDASDNLLPVRHSGLHANKCNCNMNNFCKDLVVEGTLRPEMSNVLVPSLFPEMNTLPFFIMRALIYIVANLIYIIQYIECKTEVELIFQATKLNFTT